MSLTNILQVAIGLMLIYYALGLIVNILATIAKNAFDMRAEALEGVLKKFLETDNAKKLFDDFQKHPAIKSLIPVMNKFPQFINRGDKKRKVEKIPSDTFALALLDVLATQARVKLIREGIEKLKDAASGKIKTDLEALLSQKDDDLFLEKLRSIIETLAKIENPSSGQEQERKELEGLITLVLGTSEDQLEMIRKGIEGLPAGKTQKALLGLVNFSKKDINNLRKEVEKQYDNMMKNVSLLFARNIRWVVVIISALVTAFFGTDSIQVARDLWEQPLRQQAIMETLSPVVEEHGRDAYIEWKETENTLTQAEREEKIEEGVADLASIVNRLLSLEDVSVTWEHQRGPFNKKTWEENAPLKLLGLLLTWIAISQGSSFWYNILKKIKTQTTTTDSSQNTTTDSSQVAPSTTEPSARDN